LYTNITSEDGTPSLHSLNILFSAPMASDGEIVFDGESWLDLSISGIGDSASGPDAAYLYGSSFFGFGWDSE
jgi:hypothetical protein